jgi:hypothetical protein
MTMGTPSFLRAADPRLARPLAPGCRCVAKPYTACMHRDTKELLIGSATILLFGGALVVWPPLGFYINDTVHVALDLIWTLF